MRNGLSLQSLHCGLRCSIFAIHFRKFAILLTLLLVLLLFFFVVFFLLALCAFLIFIRVLLLLQLFRVQHALPLIESINDLLSSLFRFDSLPFFGILHFFGIGTSLWALGLLLVAFLLLLMRLLVA